MKQEMFVRHYAP